MDKLLIIDGNALMHRAFHALPPLNAPDGTPTNAVLGFFSMILKMRSELQPTHFAICFDTPKPTFRKILHKEYQAKRPKMDTGLVSQIPVIKELVDKAGIVRLEKEGFEADDVIGTLAEKFKREKDLQIFILTGDRDILQLVDDNVFVVTPLMGLTSVNIYDRQKVAEKFGVEPGRIPDWKALAGDNSDNYSGAKGIGPKTAVRLLQDGRTIESLLENINNEPEGRVKDLLLAAKENIILSKQLATIIKDVEIDVSLPQCRFTAFSPDMKETLHKYSLYTLEKRIFREEKLPAKKKEDKKIDENQQTLF